MDKLEDGGDNSTGSGSSDQVNSSGPHWDDPPPPKDEKHWDGPPPPKGSGDDSGNDPVSEALRKAHVETASQIVTQQKAKADTHIALGRAEEDRSEKTAQMKTAAEWYDYWVAKEYEAEDSLRNIGKNIDDLSDLSSNQQ